MIDVVGKYLASVMILYVVIAIGVTAELGTLNCEVLLATIPVIAIAVRLWF